MRLVHIQARLIPMFQKVSTWLTFKLDEGQACLPALDDQYNVWTCSVKQAIIMQSIVRTCNVLIKSLSSSHFCCSTSSRGSVSSRCWTLLAKQALRCKISNINYNECPCILPSTQNWTIIEPFINRPKSACEMQRFWLQWINNIYSSPLLYFCNIF